jgi:hypothetical protein
MINKNKKSKQDIFCEKCSKVKDDSDDECECETDKPRKAVEIMQSIVDLFPSRGKNDEI